MIGIDYASVDENDPPDVEKLKAAGVEFVYLRKCYPSVHGYAVDPVFERDAKTFQNAGIAVGAYAFWSFNKHNSYGLYAQTDTVLSSPGGFGDLPFVSDVEFPGNGVADTGYTQAECFKMVQEFYTDIVDRLKPCATYTSHVEWHDTNGLGGPVWASAAGSPLWIKTPYPFGHELRRLDSYRLPHVGYRADDPADLWRIPGPWETEGYWIQQIHGDVRNLPGIKQCDVNVFNTCHMGEQSGRVKWFQKRLNDVTPDGIFGQDTETALMAFQYAHSIPTTGVVDVKTFAELSNV